MKLLLVRANRNEADQSALLKLGIESEVDPFLKIQIHHNPSGALRMLDAILRPGPKWLVITSTNALSYWDQLLPAGQLRTAMVAPGLRFAAIGSQTERQLLEMGAGSVVRAERSDGQSLAQRLSLETPAPVILPSGSIAMRDIPETLSAKGFKVISEVVYQTEAVSSAPAAVMKIARGEFDAVLLRSPSAVRAFLRFVPSPNLLLFCAGNTTAKELEKFGLIADLVAQNPDPESVATEIANYFELSAK